MLKDTENIPEEIIQAVLKAAKHLASRDLGMLSPEDKDALYTWLQQDPQHKIWLLQLPEAGAVSQLLAEFENAEALAAPALMEFHQKHLLTETKIHQVDRSAHRTHFLKTSWFRYAAAIILILGTAAYFWINSRTSEQELAGNNIPLQNDIAPGGERAVLTLADGRSIILDSAANGLLADQSGVDIVKLSNGKIVYNVNNNSGNEIMLNTMSTPRGGQYQLALPDGTHVWLNAASSITYPAIFVGSERNVKVTGEVYFEVVKNKEKPFIVDVDGKSTVQVLGTSFNINSYADEGNIKTTLVEGSVRIFPANSTIISSSEKKSGLSESKKAKTVSAILKPGQQATIPIGMSDDQNLNVTDNIDLIQVLSWKNGIFNFEGASFKEVMLQLERWYNIEVKYVAAVPDVQFKGKMNRGVKLSTIITWFSELGINTRLEGRSLIVL